MPTVRNDARDSAIYQAGCRAGETARSHRQPPWT